MTIPRMTQADVVRVGMMLGGSLPSNVPSKEPSTNRPFGFAARQPEGNRKAGPQGTEGAPGAAELPPEVARILALFLAGKSIPEIVQEVYALGSNAGRAYMERRTDVEKAIRVALAQRAV